MHQIVGSQITRRQPQLCYLDNQWLSRCSYDKTFSFAMKLHQLQALVAVADTGSIRAAARLTDLSQAAVSKALRQMEEEQQLSLLSRSASGVGLTLAGQKLLDHARLVVKQLERADAELSELRGDTPKRLSMGVAPWVMQTFMAEAIFDFHQRMPSVQLEFYEGLSAVLLPRLRDGAIDFAITPFPDEIPSQEFDGAPLLTHGCYVIARRGHPLAAATSIHQLLDQNWAVHYTAMHYPALMRQIFWQHGAVIEPHRLHCAHSTLFLLELVRNADMLGFCAAPLLLTQPTCDWVQALDLSEHFGTPTVGILTRRNTVIGTAAQYFIDCLQQVIRRHSRSSRASDLALFSSIKLLF